MKTALNILEQDECVTDNGGCEETCINTVGSYRCLCPEHLMVLSEDQHSCTCMYVTFS